MAENDPYLVSCKPLKQEYDKLKKITLTSKNFSLGRALNNSAVIPFLSISRSHCIFRKNENNEWIIEDQSSFGIKINGDRLGRGVTRKLSHEDEIVLEPSQEFTYKFIDPNSDMLEIPRKRIKLENSIDSDLIKLKFEESQSYEIQHIEDKIQNAKQLQTTSKILKEQLQMDMDRKMQQLEIEFASQIENLKGEKNEVERQKALLVEERDAQLASVREEMEGRIAELMEQIQRHNESESELLKDNNHLKEKLLREREEFLSELNRESSSKQDLLEKLEAKMREQEEIRQREKKELEESLKKETELLRQAKELEIKELEEQKKKREQELMLELHNIKENLEAQVEQTTQQRLQAEQKLNEQMEQMKKLSDEDKIKMEQLMREREQIEKKLTVAESNAKKSIDEALAQVKEREIELAALAAERIQKQAEHSSEVISSLQQQLEKMRSQLQSVETEKNTLLESLCLPDSAGEGTSNSKQTALAEVGELMESELQCSICAELFVAATTLNCSHTFCKYCITMWKKKKKDCPICRASITSECKSLVLDSFIEKMVQNLTEEMKKKREELLKFREELESELARQPTKENRRRRSDSYDDSDSEVLDIDNLAEEDYEGYDADDYYEFAYWRRPPWRRYLSDSDSGSDMDSDASESSESSTATVTAASSAGSAATSAPATTDSTATNSDGPAASVPPNTADEFYTDQELLNVLEGSDLASTDDMNGQTVLVVAGPARPAASSLASQAPTTVATVVASPAAPVATGRPVAPPDNQSQR